MSRVSLVGSGLVALAGWLMLRGNSGGFTFGRSRAKVPARVAAERLQQAWADHHTRA